MVGDGNQVDDIDLFESLLDEGDGVANRLLMGLNVDIDALYEKFKKNYSSKYKNKKSLFIEEYGINMNKEYNSRGFDPVFGRNKQVLRVMEILLRRTKNNPLLLGDAGVGKTAIVEELVRRIEMGDVPGKLKDVRVISLSMSSLVAGTKYRGEFEERMNQIVSELENLDDVILFIDEIHTLVGAGGAEGAIDASNILKPYLARGKLKIIGATTKDEYKKYIENEKALDRRFQKVYVDEMTLDETREILNSVKELYEDYHHVVISNSNIDEIISLCDKYVFSGKFPDKALDILDEICSKVSLVESDREVHKKKILSEIKILRCEKNKAIIENNYDNAGKLKEKIDCLENIYNEEILLSGGNDRKHISNDQIYAVFYDKTKIPISYLKGINHEEIVEAISKNVIAREDIVKKIVESSIFPLQIKKSRPSVFLFVGKSGTGKTFLAKEYARALYKEDSFIKIDMSEYKDEFSSTKILGAPPGYVGYHENKTLLDKIKDNPYSVLLLDEIEKASSSILKLFLQVFDEGIMTSSTGEIVNFSNVTIFMTSNLGMNTQQIGFSSASLNSSQIFKDYFGDEFVNRIDEIFLFAPFTKNEIKAIIKKKLTDFVEKEKVDFKISTDIVNKILNECDYLNYGTRQIDKIIKKLVFENNSLKI